MQSNENTKNGCKTLSQTSRGKQADTRVGEWNSISRKVGEN